MIVPNVERFQFCRIIILIILTDDQKYGISGLEVYYVVPYKFKFDLLESSIFEKCVTYIILVEYENINYAYFGYTYIIKGE